jgi:hypothetical protein
VAVAIDKGGGKTLAADTGEKLAGNADGQRGSIHGCPNGGVDGGWAQGTSMEHGARSTEHGARSAENGETEQRTTD